MSTTRIDQLILFQRLLIIFGSICCLWLIIGFIFLSIETYRHWKKKSDQNVWGYKQTLHLPSSLLTNIKQTLSKDYMSDNDQNGGDDDDDDDNDQTSIITSLSLISDRSKITHQHPYFTASCSRVPEEQFVLTFPIPTGISNLAYSPSTLTSSSDTSTSLLYSPACRNFAYSYSTLSSSNNNFHQKPSTPSLIIPLTNTLPSTRQFNFERQSSTNTIRSELTNATYLSLKSSAKTIPLPTLMITDVDRLQTDIIELEDFEPEKEWYHTRSQLRFLLNDRMPYQIK